MAEQFKKVQPISVSYVCDECNEGLMIPNGRTYPGSPIPFEHICNKCGIPSNYAVSYPVIKYADID